MVLFSKIIAALWLVFWGAVTMVIVKEDLSILLVKDQIMWFYVIIGFTMVLGIWVGESNGRKI